MSANVAIEIVELALTIVKSQATGELLDEATTAGILVQIVQRGYQGFEDQTGAPMDITLIRAETPV